MNTTGINYEVTGNRARGIVHNYHGKPSPREMSIGAGRQDIAGLKPAQVSQVLFGGTENRYGSLFTIGFEVEKNSLHRGAVKEYELFCGFERDGSCGYEAVTNILPLLPACQWRTKVYDMMHKATKIIDDRYSPSNQYCGGHVTIAVGGYSGDEILKATRRFSGIILALFRNRLGNTYCKYNMNMMAREEMNDANYANEQTLNGWHHKYQLALVKGDLVEFRVVSRFQSVKQMMRRYELFYELVNFSINKPEASYASFLKVIKPIVVSMYEGDVAKADRILELAKHFQRFLDTKKISKHIVRYVDKNAMNRSFYDRELAGILRDGRWTEAVPESF